VYWSFLDSRIKDKKSMLSFLEPAHKGAYYAFMCCTLINIVLLLVIDYATTIKLPATLGITLFLVYLTLLSIPRVLISGLKTSIEEEKNASKSTTCGSEDTKQ
jgi:FlaA1/EpsC-like NDP-sugar epimerase